MTLAPRILMRGMTGQDVASWQRFLNILADGIFGEKTQTATKVWQAAHALNPDGKVGPLTRAAALRPGTPPISTHRYSTTTDGRVILQTGDQPKFDDKTVILFHTMVKNWLYLVEEASTRYSLPHSWLFGIMWAESKGDPNAKSSAGALGLMQVMPFHFKTGEIPLDPHTNVMRGATVLQAARVKGPDLIQSASIYNAGMPPGGNGPWTNEIWLAYRRNPSLTTRWGYAAETGYLDRVVAGNNAHVSHAPSETEKA